MSDVFTEKPKEGDPWDVAIIGSGPSALTAAIYTTRGAASTLLLAGEEWGGQLMLTSTVDNFPGFPEGVQGQDLMNLMKNQALRFGTEFVGQSVVSIDTKISPFKLTVSDKVYTAKSIIIATGAQTRWLGIPGEDKLRGRGISSCAPCDAPFFKDKKVIVVGGGDSAMEEALVLTKYSPEVTIVHRRDQFKASQAMQQKVLNNPKIKVIWDSEVVEAKGEQLLEKVTLKTKADSPQAKELKTGRLAQEVGALLSEDADVITWDLPTQGMFVAIGHDPSTKVFQGNIELDEKGYIIKKEYDGYKMGTSAMGVFVAGDVHDIHYRQAITAAGFGCMAALEVLKYLDKETPSW